jgi:hypothetical protein
MRTHLFYLLYLYITSVYIHTDDHRCVCVGVGVGGVSHTSPLAFLIASCTVA